jgi:hypothetical protein
MIPLPIGHDAAARISADRQASNPAAAVTGRAAATST